MGWHKCVFQNIAKCKQPGWYPGKVHGQRTGRTPVISVHQKESIARVLMETTRHTRAHEAHARTSTDKEG